MRHANTAFGTGSGRGQGLTYIGLVDHPGERGRTDDRESLRLALATAPPEYLLGALENPALGPEELLLAIENQGATPEILSRIGRTPAWMRSRDAKRALVSHPKTPAVLSRRFLPHLFWRELVDVAGSLRVPPVIRREAEKLVRLRMSEITLGERVTLARIASRGLIAGLRSEDDPAVLKALAGNPRVTEADVLEILARPGVPPEFLGWLADQSAWAQRGAPRGMLTRHPRTPTASALRLVGKLAERQLEDLASDEAAPRLVRVAALRRLGVDTHSGASLQSPADRRHPGLRGLSTSR